MKGGYSGAYANRRYDPEAKKEKHQPHNTEEPQSLSLLKKSGPYMGPLRFVLGFAPLPSVGSSYQICHGRATSPPTTVLLSCSLGVGSGTLWPPMPPLVKVGAWVGGWVGGGRQDPSCHAGGRGHRYSPARRSLLVYGAIALGSAPLLLTTLERNMAAQWGGHSGRKWRGPPEGGARGRRKWRGEGRRQ